MSDTVKNGIIKALEMVVVVTEKFVFPNHCKTAQVKITCARFRIHLEQIWQLRAATLNK
jgi:hypothetical protein